MIAEGRGLRPRAGDSRGREARSETGSSPERKQILKLCHFLGTASGASPKSPGGRSIGAPVVTSAVQRGPAPGRFWLADCGWTAAGWGERAPRYQEIARPGEEPVGETLRQKQAWPRLVVKNGNV